MNDFIVGVDVDLTVVRSDLHWFHWLKINYGKPDESIFVDNREYNLTKYWPHIGDKYDRMFDFWRKEDLYDNLSPIPDAVEYLNLLHLEGCKIFFASHIKGNSHKSKYYFLEKNFPFLAGFAATQEKHFIDCDVFIDDRTTNLLPFKDRVKLIRYDTIYKQDCEDTDRITVCKTWEDIYNVVMKYKEEKIE